MYTNLRFLNRDLSDSPQPRRLHYSPVQERKAKSMSPAKQPRPSSFLPPLQSKPSRSKALLQPVRRTPTVEAGEDCGYVFGFGLGAGFYRPIGVGFLLTRDIALTARSVIHSQEMARRCQLQFTDGEIYDFSPYRLFLALPHLNLTLTAVEPAESPGRLRDPVDIVNSFGLDEEEAVQHIGVSQVQSKVRMVDAQRFYFRSGGQLLPGTPVFDKSWRFQGVTVTSSATYHYNEAIRVDCLAEALLASASIFTASPDMQTLLSRLYYRPKPDTNNEEEVCWFEWMQQRVIGYRVDLDRWNTRDIGNADELEMESRGDWYFRWGSKCVRLPDSCYLVVGGSERQNPVAEAYHYSPAHNRVTRCDSLKVGRQACGLAVLNGFVYALGGEYTNGSCEQYSLSALHWSFISPMNIARHAINAVGMGSWVYVAGGLPLVSAGSTVERYLPQRDEWELLPVTLPEPLCNSALCVVAQDSLAIMGGRLSTQVYMLKILGSTSSFFLTSANTLSLHECLSFTVPTETLYPVLLSSRTNTAYLFNCHEGEHRPVLVKYRKDCFFRRPRLRREGLDSHSFMY